METIRSSVFGTDASVALVIPGYEPYKIPKNWCWTTFDVIAKWGSGGTPSRNNPGYYTGNIPWIKTGELNDDYVYDTEEHISEYAIQKSAAKKYPVNTIMIAMYGATIGKVGIMGLEAATNQACANGVCRNNVYFKYLFYYAISQRENFLKKAKGGAQPNISQEVIKQHEFPLAPLAEQHRIVEKIESLFSKLDKAKENAQKVLNSFEMRKASILNNAFSGKLTEKWRKEHKTRLNSWKNSSLASLSEKVFDGPFGSNLKSEDYVDSGIRVVRLENLKNLWFDDSKQSFITKQKYATIKKHTVYPSDLIMSTFIADEIKVCQMPSYIQYAVNKADCIGIRLKEDVNKHFVLYYLSSKLVYNLLKNEIHGATRPRVNSKQIKSINVLRPSIDEQNAIVQLLDNFINIENEAKQSAESVIEQIDLMKKSILSKAFRGELGTNNPNDESAEELLKKILYEIAIEEKKRPKTTKKRIVIPKEIENLIGTNLEQKIIKLFFENEAREVPVEEILSLSSKVFDVLEAIRSLEHKQLIKKITENVYKFTE